MFPYDYTKENYSKLGYLYEGVTTYMGDMFLLKSEVFSLEQYLEELTVRLQSHFDNFGRFNYSVAQSSFDTWLDGYENIAPNRKVSIYNEGCLLAFVADIMLLKNTNNKYGLDEVMKRLYFDFALQKKGISENDYKNVLENVGSCSFEQYFIDYVNGTKSYETILVEALEIVGLELDVNPSEFYSHAKLGLKCIVENNKTIVKNFYIGGPADLGGMMLEDEIIALNGFEINDNLDKWLEYFEFDEKKIIIKRKDKIIELIIPEVNRNFYMKYGIKIIETPNNQQKKNLEAWIK
jgi:predicted metalloprotease with PDZ domain